MPRKSACALRDCPPVSPSTRRSSRLSSTAAQARNAADGTVKFDLSYTLADLKQADGSYADAKTFTYTVHEHEPAAKLPGVTYSEQTYTVTVTLTDDAAGQLKAEVSGSTDGLFTNTYKAAPTTIQLNASKMLEGRSLKEGEFTFQVTDEEGNVAAHAMLDELAEAQ